MGWFNFYLGSSKSTCPPPAHFLDRIIEVEEMVMGYKRKKGWDIRVKSLANSQSILSRRPLCCFGVMVEFGVRLALISIGMV